MDLASVRAGLQSAAWPEGWSPCSSAEERALAVQLQREVEPGHALHGHDCVALGKSAGAERVLYFVPGSENPLAVVRLTWRVPREPGRFPWTQGYDGVEAWVRDEQGKRGKGREGGEGGEGPND